MDFRGMGLHLCVFRSHHHMKAFVHLEQVFRLESTNHQITEKVYSILEENYNKKSHEAQ